MMRLTVLGSSGAFPGKGKACSGYLLQTETVNILIDCGSGTATVLFDILPVEKLDAIILTHLHHDHCSDLGVLSYRLGLEGKKSDTPLYLPAEKTHVHGGICSMKEFITNGIGGPLWFGDLTISFARTVHSAETYMVIAEKKGKKLVYTADTRYFDGLEDLCAGADLLICDAAVDTKRHTGKTPHMSAAECGKLAKECGAKRLLLTHMIPFTDMDQNELIKEAKNEFSNVEIVIDKNTYEV